MLDSCIFKVVVYKAVDTFKFYFLILYFFECGASFKISKIGVNGIAFRSESGKYWKLENLTSNMSKFWSMPKAASRPIGLLMVIINLIPFQHT